MELFRQLQRASAEKNLPLLLVGGHAVNAYGYSRTTLDVDMLIAVETFPHWRPVLESLGYTRTFPTSSTSFPFATSTPPAKNFIPSSHAMPTMKHATCSSGTLVEGDLGLPPIGEPWERTLGERPPPTFGEQIAHSLALARMNNRRAPDHPPRNDERFEI
jgi:hypothetical protein